MQDKTPPGNAMTILLFLPSAGLEPYSSAGYRNSPSPIFLCSFNEKHTLDDSSQFWNAKKKKKESQSSQEGDPAACKCSPAVWSNVRETYAVSPVRSLIKLNWKSLPQNKMQDKKIKKNWKKKKRHKRHSKVRSKHFSCFLLLCYIQKEILAFSDTKSPGFQLVLKTERWWTQSWTCLRKSNKWTKKEQQSCNLWL